MKFEETFKSIFAESSKVSSSDTATFEKRPTRDPCKAEQNVLNLFYYGSFYSVSFECFVLHSMFMLVTVCIYNYS